MTGFACMVPLCRADRGPTSPQWGNSHPVLLFAEADRCGAHAAGDGGHRQFGTDEEFMDGGRRLDLQESAYAAERVVPPAGL